MIKFLVDEWKIAARNRRSRQLDAYIDKVRKATDGEKKVFLERCVQKAYYPLYLAFVALEASNFVVGNIIEETTGERFKLELRKVRETPEQKEPTV